jgi:hypothetical protein
VHVVSLTPHAQFLRLKIDHISASSKQNSKRLWPVNQGEGILFDEKTEGRKSRDTVPFKAKNNAQIPVTKVKFLKNGIKSI